MKAKMFFQQEKEVQEAKMHFQLGQELQILKWNLHYFAIIAQKRQVDLQQKRGSCKFVRQIRILKSVIKLIDHQLKTETTNREDAVERLLIQASLICIAASNYLNEKVYKEKAYKKGMKTWNSFDRVVNSYQAGICCTVLNIIHEKLSDMQFQKTNAALEKTFGEKLCKSMDKLLDFEFKIKQSPVFTLELKFELLTVHLSILSVVLFCFNKC